MSAEVVDYANQLGVDAADDWGVESGETEPPGAVQATVARVVNRSIANPFGYSGEQLGDHNYQMPSGAAGGTLAPKDKKIIRRAVGKLGAGTHDLEGFLPLEPRGFDGDSELVL